MREELYSYSPPGEFITSSVGHFVISTFLTNALVEFQKIEVNTTNFWGSLKRGSTSN